MFIDQYDIVFALIVTTVISFAAGCGYAQGLHLVIIIPVTLVALWLGYLLPRLRRLYEAKLDVTPN